MAECHCIHVCRKSVTGLLLFMFIWLIIIDYSTDKVYYVVARTLNASILKENTGR